MAKINIKDKKLETSIKRQNNLARGQGVKKGKKLGMKKGIWLSGLTVLTLGIIGTGTYMIVLAVKTQNISLTTEIQTKDLNTITIKKEQVEKGASDNQILLKMINKNKNTIKNMKDYKVSNIQYDKNKLTGEAKIYSTNWLSKQEVKVTYKVEVEENNE